jgi:hypothetical protein
MTLQEAIAEVLFENPATQRLAELAAEKYQTAIEDGDDRAATKWHAQILSCCRGRPRKKREDNDEMQRMSDALLQGDA